MSGKVQGVFFRASTRDAAASLGINGHAKNLADGSVDVLACGDDESVQRLRDWLSQGPPMARVEQIEELSSECAAPDKFRIG